MKKGFRSVEFWKSALMILPDDSFFELLRSVFGKIKTPFNKQMLLDSLESFLLRKDIQQTIACFIDQNDARIIAALAALGEPAPGELESFFSGELSYASLHDQLVNLEERFICYRFREGGVSRIALNPLMKTILAPAAADTSLLFPPVPPEEAAGKMTHNKAPPVLDDRVIAALFSFVPAGEPFFKAGSGMRKRLLDAAGKVFPGLAIEPVIGGLRVLGLFRAEAGRLIPDLRRFAGFGKLTRRERLEYLAAGICCFSAAESKADIIPWLLRGQLAALTAFTRRFLDSLETERLYPPGTLQALAFMLDRGEAAADGQKKLNASALVEALQTAGLLVKVSAQYYRLCLPAAESADSGKTPLIAMDAAFSCLVYPEISCADAISLAAMMEIREAGTTVRFELTRDSAVRAFNRGCSADMMIGLLRRLSGNRIDEPLVWTLQDWEKRHGEVRLQKGLVLSLAPERRYLAETLPLAALIRASLAPGIYLLDETTETAALESLRKAGVAIVACQTEAAGPFAGEEGQPQKFFAPLGTGGSGGIRPPKPAPAVDARKNFSKNSAKVSTVIAGFRSILEQMPLGKEERDELAARIDRRLVLNESQLRDAAVRYEKLEARGLDYVGKAIIAKQAIALQSPLEIVMPGKSGERFFGIPKALEKEGGESVLTLSPLAETGGSGGLTRIPLGKISLLRRIKKSIFEHAGI
jgi:hypothetical protein